MLVGGECQQWPRGVIVSPMTPVELQLRQLCTTSVKIEVAERAKLTTCTAPVLEKAPHPGMTIWKFIIDRSTSYLDRMAVAKHGGWGARPRRVAHALAGNGRGSKGSSPHFSQACGF
jgi:hypothetical protein